MRDTDGGPRLGRLRGRYCAVWYDSDGRRHRKNLGTDDRATAERILRRIIQDSTRPEAARTVRGLWDAYCAEMRGRAVIGAMVYSGRAVLPRFGDHEPDTVDLDLSRAHTAARRAAGLSDGTIHTELGHLMMVFNWAVKRGLIARVPPVERPPKPPPRDRYLTREEIARLLDAATKPHVRLAILLLIGTGARIEALSQLTWDRVDLDAGLIHLADPADRARRKGRAILPMNRSVRAALAEARTGALTDHVIEWAGRPVKSLKRSLRTASKKAGVTGVSHHVFRHSAAVWMVEGGIGMEEVAQFLGHRSVETTRRIYARFSPTYLRAAAEILSVDTPRRFRSTSGN